MKTKGLLTTISLGTALLLAASAMAQTDKHATVVDANQTEWTMDRCIESMPRRMPERLKYGHKD